MLRDLTACAKGWAEPMKITLLRRYRAGYRVDRSSRRKETAEALLKRMNLSAAT